MSKQNAFHIGHHLEANSTYEGSFRASEDGAIVVCDGHGRFYEQGSRRKIYSVMTNQNTGLVITTNMLGPQGTANTFLGILNPLGSGVNLEILQGWIGLRSATATGAGMWSWSGTYQGGAVTNAGATATAFCNYVSQNVPKARYYSNTPFTGGRASALIRPFPLTYFAAAAAATTENVGVDNVDGSIVVPPGCSIALCAAATGTNFTMVGGILYAEVPLPQQIQQDAS